MDDSLSAEITPPSFSGLAVINYEFCHSEQSEELRDVFNYVVECYIMEGVGE